MEIRGNDKFEIQMLQIHVHKSRGFCELCFNGNINLMMHSVSIRSEHRCVQYSDGQESGRILSLKYSAEDALMQHGIVFRMTSLHFG